MDWNRISTRRRPPLVRQTAVAPPVATTTSFFAPLHYEPAYAYPLIVWLGESGGLRLSNVMPRVSLRNYVAVSTTVTGRDAAVDSAVRAVDEAKRRFHIGSNRVFVAGALAGGTAAISAALAAPEVFAGAASLCGRFPRGHAALSDLKAVRSTPLLFCTSRRGDAYPEATACKDIRLLHAAGMLATFRQYPGDEEPHAQAFADLDAWIMKQINPELVATGG